MPKNKRSLAAQIQTDRVVPSRGPNGDVIVAMMAYLYDTAERPETVQTPDLAR